MSQHRTDSKIATEYVNVLVYNLYLWHMIDHLKRLI